METSDLPLQPKDNLPQRCILDSLLSQPANTKAAELMRNTYNETPGQLISTRVLGQPIPVSPLSVKSILMEHCYARPYNWRPDAKFLRPTRTLFIKKNIFKNTTTDENADKIIDVCNRPVETPLSYDIINAKSLMEECERHVIGVRDGPDWEEWQDKVPKIHWSMIQHNLFNSVVELLDSDRMARLSYTGHKNEATLRRTVIDKSVNRFRLLMAKYIWDVKLVQWLHGLLMENMSGQYLAVYLDILQTLRHKLPTFVEKLVKNPNLQPSLYPALNPDKVEQLLSRVWDPVENTQCKEKPKPLPGNPVIMIIPSATILAYNKTSKRIARLASLFSDYGIVVTVQNTTGCSRNMTINDCTDHIMFTVHAKFEEIKAEHPEKQIVLVACNSSCAFALQLAQAENVVCIINLGFSIYTPTGSRGCPEDNLLDLLTPVLFVIGQVANTALQENMQDIRERMRVETGLIIVGGADDCLRVNKKVKRAEGITQSMADRCIVDEVADFVSGILLSPYPPKLRQNTSPACFSSEPKRIKTDRKRNNSNGSSLDSEPPSPTPRNIRTGKVQPVGMVGIYGGFPKAMSGLRGMPASPSKQIKVLDNISIAPGSTGKIMHRPDLHKLPQSTSPSYSNNIVLEGRYKSAASPSVIRGSSQLTKLLTSKQFIATNPSSQGTPRPTARANLTKHIITKRQLQTQGNRPKQIRKLSTYLPPDGTSLPPPTNLTSQDIMDLPIIFADDNQMLANNTIQPSDLSSPPVTPTQIRTTTGKVMFLNKTFASGLTTPVKRSSLTKMPQNIRFKKIIMTKAPEETKPISIGIPMDVDLEGELVANTIAKKFIVSRSEDASYKTEVMSPSLVTTKIKQAIEVDSEYDVLNETE